MGAVGPARAGLQSLSCTFGADLLDQGFCPRGAKVLGQWLSPTGPGSPGCTLRLGLFYRRGGAGSVWSLPRPRAGSELQTGCQPHPEIPLLPAPASPTPATAGHSLVSCMVLGLPLPRLSPLPPR